QLLDKMRIGQEAHVEHEVGVERHAAFEAERDERDGEPRPLLRRHVRLDEHVLELVHGHVRGIHDAIGHLAHRGQRLALCADAVEHVAVGGQRMPPPRLAVAAHERLLVGLEEHDFHDVAALAQGDQRVEAVTEVLTFPDVDAEGHAVALVARSGDEIGEGRHERGRQVVDTEEPHVFEALDRVRLAGSTQARDDHEGDRLRHGWRGGQRRFGANRRWCDGRIPSSSRYFATVRRAMVSPRPLRINATSWSESGFDGSSLASRSWIIFFTDTDETISPSPEAMPEWKKNFSSNSPCGVSTYLLVVTRLIVDSCMPMSSPTSRSDSGRRYGRPLSRNSRWNFTMDCVTLRSVRWRWSTDLISHSAERSFWSTYCRASPSAELRSSER